MITFYLYNIWFNKEEINIKEYTYTCSDGRIRTVIYDNGKTTTKSYPRIIVEDLLGRELKENEDIHHIDGNPLNNSIENLEIVEHGEHQKEHRIKYHDKKVNCFYCGKEFIWTAHSQSIFYVNANRIENKGKERHVFCSKSCSGKYGRNIQLMNKKK